MILYKIVHHTPDHIRIEVSFKEHSLARLHEIRKKISLFPKPDGIEYIKPSLISGCILIKYKREKIDIVEYLKNLASPAEIQNLLDI
ncbi:MAG: hypothetical protein N3A59_01630 [Thermodesulfovibrionales bacterium]|nr:hypothetical protein [Thermodesulfovibrionales bacterium]